MVTITGIVLLLFGPLEDFGRVDIGCALNNAPSGSTVTMYVSDPRIQAAQTVYNEYPATLREDEKWYASVPYWGPNEPHYYYIVARDSNGNVIARRGNRFNPRTFIPSQL